MEPTPKVFFNFTFIIKAAQKSSNSRCLPSLPLAKTRQSNFALHPGCLLQLGVGSINRFFITDSEEFCG